MVWVICKEENSAQNCGAALIVRRYVKLLVREVSAAYS